MKKVILACLALLIITILGCSKEKEQAKPPYPKGNAKFEGEVLFNGQKIEGIGNGAAFVKYINPSRDTVSVGFADYSYQAGSNSWYQFTGVGLTNGKIPSDSTLLQDYHNNPRLNIANASYEEMFGDSDALIPPWLSDSGFYSLQQNPDSSISAHVEARLVRDAPSQREEFLTDTIELYIKGKFTPL